MRLNELPSIGVVTAGEHKVRAIREQLPQHHVLWVRPHEHIKESVIASDIPHNNLRPAFVSREKALADLIYWHEQTKAGGQTDWLAYHRFEGAWVDGEIHMSLYNDVIRYIPELEFVLERPTKYKEWLYQALMQSGKQIWISAGHTGVHLDYESGEHTMHTVGVVTQLQVRRFTKPEIRAFADSVGIERMMDSSGGVPVGLADSFFDKSAPISSFFYPDAMKDETIPLRTISWNDVSPQSSNHFASGAFREPLTHLIDRVGFVQ